MSLSSGSKLGPYEVLSPLGAGGMGEVYRARDTRLGREVAIKVLPADLMADQARRRRFALEARAASALNHPNIVTVHEVDSVDGTDFIVMEYVSGRTLGAHLSGRSLPVPEALRLGVQMADALARAHAAGIVHRDLKPSNVMVGPHGSVKILDFGLAKLVIPEEELAERNTLSHDPESLTRPGAIAGTPGYMSPEQATGGKIDARSDIFSFGALLYEMVAGRRAFAGKGVAEAVAAAMHHTPKPPSELSSSVPEGLDKLILRCLRKEPDRRFQSMADVKVELRELEEERAAKGPSTPAPRRGRAWLAAAILCALGLGVATLLVWRRTSSPRATALPGARLSLNLPAGQSIVGLTFPSLSISPDGSRLAYVTGSAGEQRLVLRALSELQGALVPGTEGARSPFFSPDGQWIGFFAGGKLKKVSVHGGEPASLCNAPNPHGASWGPRGRIVFAPIVYSGLSEVSADGGTPRSITALDSNRGERAHRWPELLPDGRAVVFTVWTGARWEDSQIVAQSLGTGERRVLVQGGTSARYAPSGHLVYARAGTLMVVPFDPNRLEVTGPPVPLADGVMQSSTGAAQFSLAGLASLVYVPGAMSETEHSLVTVDRQGKAVPLPMPPRAYFSPRVSPDGRRLAVEIAGVSTDLYVYDLANGQSVRLTFEASNTFPVWTPDGKRVAFQSNRAGPLNLFWKAADGSGNAERLTTGEHPDAPNSWSPDGKFLAFHRVHPDAGRDLWVVSVEGDPQPRLFLAGKANEGTPAFSPNGRWLAYTSDESGRSEVYVQPFPGPGGRWQVSTDGGTEPVWARSGREIFYWRGEGMMAVPIAGGEDFVAGKPALLFQGQYEKPFGRPNYDVTPDGRHFVMVRGAEPPPPVAQLGLVLDWFNAVRRRGAP